MKPGKVAGTAYGRGRPVGTLAPSRGRRGRWQASRRRDTLGPAVWLLGVLLVAACFGVMELLYRI